MYLIVSVPFVEERMYSKNRLTQITTSSAIPVVKGGINEYLKPLKQIAGNT
jgi:hypothetical protein